MNYFSSKQKGYVPSYITRGEIDVGRLVFIPAPPPRVTDLLGLGPEKPEKEEKSEGEFSFIKCTVFSF